MIAPTARVHPLAVVGPQTVVGEFCVIEEDVTIGAFCRFEPYVYVKRYTTMGDYNEISASTVLGTDPLDKNFRGGRSYLRIGSHNRIREHYTVSRGTAEESATEIGNRNYIMTAGHIAHNCRIGDDCVIASCALLAGYVEVEDQAFISGSLAIHQFSRIGRLAMVAGMTRVNRDLPPYFLYAGPENVGAVGLNLVGLRRAGFEKNQIGPLKEAFRVLFRTGKRLEDALAEISERIPTPETLYLVEFIRKSRRGIVRSRRDEHAAG